MYINLTKTKGCLKKMTILMMTTDCSGIGWHSLSSRSWRDVKPEAIVCVTFTPLIYDVVVSR